MQFRKLGVSKLPPRREDKCACGCGRVVTARDCGYAQPATGRVWSKFCRPVSS
jgi:hypothetical protein